MGHITSISAVGLVPHRMEALLRGRCCGGGPAEIPFIRDNIRRHHETAVRNKAKIVHFCGFDSVPMDLGALFVVDAIRKRYQT